MADQFTTRKNVRLAELNYRGRRCYFVTFCSLGRKPFLAEEKTACWLINLLHTESSHFSFRAGVYCLMPDHLHFLSEGSEASCHLLRFVKSLKIKSSRWYAQFFDTVLWRKGFYDHVLRPSESLESVAWYIGLNPARKGIVDRPKEFPYSGSFSGIEMPTD